MGFGKLSSPFCLRAKIILPCSKPSHESEQLQVRDSPKLITCRLSRGPVFSKRTDQASLPFVSQTVRGLPLIIVTGASRGLGAAIANRLLGVGEEVFGLSRNVEGLDYPATSCDVANPEEVHRASREIRSTGKRIKGLINAAGIGFTNFTLLASSTELKSVIEVNLLGTIYCSQAFTPMMVKGHFGRIINFSSIAVALGIRGEAAYSASKAGVEGFSRSFAREVSTLGITVNCISPGPILTDMLEKVPEAQVSSVVNQQIIQKMFAPDDICDLVELLLDKKADSLTGGVFHVGGV